MGTAGSLIVARVLQALGASAGIVVSRAIIRDLFDREHAAAMIGLVATVMVVVPLFGPLIGGLLETGFGWEAIFLFTATTSAAVVLWGAVVLPETRALNVTPGAKAGFFRDLADLSKSARFIGYVLTSAFGSGTFFVFLGAGPHVIITLMGRSPPEYGLWFALSSVGYMFGNFLVSRLSSRLGIDRLIWCGIAMEALGVISMTILVGTAMPWGPAIVIIPQLIVGIGNGLLLPGSISGAISIRPQAAGTAAGISGFSQMALGAALTQFAGWLIADSPSAMAMPLLMNGVVLGLALSFALLVRRR
jgi:DHA1 family bicyclomycin/chloramphenicol resistance-like MFS transporter